MIIKTRQRREYVRVFLLSFAVDLFIVALISIAFKLGLGESLATYLAIQAVRLAAWIRSTAIEWVVWLLGARKAFVSHIVDFLRTNAFPPPEMYLESVSIYFSEVTSNENVDMKTRLAAMAELSFIQALPKLGLFQHSLRLGSAYESALSEYRTTNARA